MFNNHVQSIIIYLEDIEKGNEYEVASYKPQKVTPYIYLFPVAAIEKTSL